MDIGNASLERDGTVITFTDEMVVFLHDARLHCIGKRRIALLTAKHHNLPLDDYFDWDEAADTLLLAKWDVLARRPHV